MNALNKVLSALRSMPVEEPEENYTIPNRWVSTDMTEPPQLLKVSPSSYFIDSIESIMRQPSSPLSRGEKGDWTRNAVTYNALIRLTTAFDHNQNGQIDLDGTKPSFRETGTFLKMTALLPYLKQMGINTLHLLPITAIGIEGRKGSLGSPYAIKNPFVIDEHLSEPILRLEPDVEFEALVEAAHHLGIRVVLEFVFRTASQDSDWIPQHPEWFYWIKEGSKTEKPIFDEMTLNKIRAQIDRNDFSDLPQPSENYKKSFYPAPKKETVYREGHRWLAKNVDGTTLTIPPAFADWPPDDNQPSWNDVTYLKMHNHPDFNYVAYNTLRMYDDRLNREDYTNQPLWNEIAGIIPHYQNRFHIDGVMIDMGHALPRPLLQKLLQTARSNNPDFAFWEENFNPGPDSVSLGYNAAIGHFWSVEEEPKGVHYMIDRYAKEGFALPCFGTPESHNTKRAASKKGGILYSKLITAFNAFLPALFTIHSGLELCETFPVNTGLQFTPEEIKLFEKKPLPLFHESALPWMAENSLLKWMEKLTQIRERYQDLILDDAPSSFERIQSVQDPCFAFLRKNEKLRIWVVGNMDYEASQTVTIPIEGSSNEADLTELLSNRLLKFPNNPWSIDLEPGGIRAFLASSSAPRFL